MCLHFSVEFCSCFLYIIPFDKIKNHKAMQRIDSCSWMSSEVLTNPVTISTEAVTWLWWYLTIDMLMTAPKWNWMNNIASPMNLKWNEWKKEINNQPYLMSTMLTEKSVEYVLPLFKISALSTWLASTKLLASFDLDLSINNKFLLFLGLKWAQMFEIHNIRLKSNRMDWTNWKCEEKNKTNYKEIVFTVNFECIFEMS